MWQSDPTDWTISSVKSGQLRSVICGQPTSVLTIGDDLPLLIRGSDNGCVVHGSSLSIERRWPAIRRTVHVVMR